MEQVDGQNKYGEPSSCKYQIQRPAEAATGVREEPNQAEENGDRGNSLGIDEAFLGPISSFVGPMDLNPYEIGDNLGVVSIGGATALRNLRWQI